MQFIKSQDIINAKHTHYVNPVNCVGVMGKGLALEYKKRYPIMYKEYKALCDDKLLYPGRLHIWNNLIINFPTKIHWKDKSRYEWIESGLITLRNYISSLDNYNIGMPALGCGNGGLDFDLMKELIVNILSDCKSSITIYY